MKGEERKVSDVSESRRMPTSVKLFEGLYLCGLVLLIVRVLLHREADSLVDSVELEEFVKTFIRIAMIWVIVLAIVPFVFLASRKKSKVCQWILMGISMLFIISSGLEGLLSPVVAIIFGLWFTERESVHVFVRWGGTIAGMAYIVYMSSLFVTHGFDFRVVVFLQTLVPLIAVLLLSTKSGKLWLSPNDGGGEKSE